MLKRPPNQESGHHANAAVNVLRKVKIDGKWSMLPLARVGNRIDWEHVLVAGKPTVVAGGMFYLEYREPGRKSKVRRAVGSHSRDAKVAMSTQATVLGLRRDGVQVDDAPEITKRQHIEGPRIAEIVSAFVQAPPIKLRRKSILKYVNALQSFVQWTGKTHVSQLGRDDIAGFMTHLVRVKGLNLSTAIDKAVIALSVMREHGAAIKMHRGDWPRVTQQQPDIYTPEVLKPLFAAMREDEVVLFQTFLLTGMREQEVGFLAWEDFSSRAGTLRVSKKAAFGFDPKNYQERTLPIPPQLVALLKAHRRQQSDEYFIFPTGSHNVSKGASGGQRDRHMLAKLKAMRSVPA